MITIEDSVPTWLWCPFHMNKGRQGSIELSGIKVVVTEEGTKNGHDLQVSTEEKQLKPSGSTLQRPAYSYVAGLWLFIFSQVLAFRRQQLAENLSKLLDEL